MQNNQYYECVFVLVDDAADEPSGRANIGLRSVNEIRILDKKNSVYPCVCVCNEYFFLSSCEQLKCTGVCSKTTLISIWYSQKYSMT